MRSAKELLIASKEFASEKRWISWWHLWSTIAALVALVAIATSDLHLAIRTLASVGAGLVAVRLFIIYHDFQHGAILSNSPVAHTVMWLYGIILLNPASVWNRSHDHHHKHNSKDFGANIGSYPVMTTEGYSSASRGERFAYAATRHPLIMVFGFFSVFHWGMCIRPFFANPRRHWDAGLASILNIIALIGLCFIGVDVMVLGLLLPLMVAAALGAYLFYAQHNFPSAVLRDRSDWSHVDAALHSSSYISMGPVLNWFTGNIGYHHVHHLNARIPFYRLPEAMHSLEELQSPGKTSLHPRDVVACLRLKLWSIEQQRFIGFRDARAESRVHTQTPDSQKQPVAGSSRQAA